MISGVLNVTVEVPSEVAPASANDANYIQLDEKQKYGTIEAGSYLAWRPATDTTNEIGNQIVYAIGEDVTTDFTPGANGLYVFRRAVKTDDSNPPADTAYDYVGYYYYGGTYYKLHSINVTSDMIDENGSLKSAPTVNYAKKVTKTVKNVPMTYESAESRLKVQFDANADPDTTALDTATYNAYRAYLDAYSGKTTWDEGTDDDSNTTGLTTYDKYSVDDPGDSEVKGDLTNFSLTRLDTRRTATSAQLETDSTDMDTNYSNAKASRDTVNKGQDAAVKLGTLKASIVEKIGDNLVQEDNTPWHYSATAGDENHVPSAEGASPNVTLATATSTPYVDDTTMSADNLDESRFSDNNGVFGSGVSFNVTIAAPYSGTLTDQTLKDAWDNYVLQTERLALVNAKIAIVEDVIANNSVPTNVGRNNTEANAYLAVLNNDKAAIEAALEAAKNTYDGLVEQMAADIETLNGYQNLVNAANAEYTATEQATITDHSTVYSNGADDTEAEDTLETQLITVYGIALKDANGNDYSEDAPYDNMNQGTYSPTVTKDTIDNNLTNTAGVIGWKSPLAPTNLDTSAVQNGSYFQDEKVRYMQEYRQGQVDALYAAYEAATTATGETTATASPIIMYVNLANLDDAGTTVDKWQYIADATAANEYNFYYTGILESGETSSLLIKDVTFDNSVTQDAFIDMQFDINVALESAQVVYTDGDIVDATAAKATIEGAEPSAATYPNTDATVTWTKRAGGVNNQKENPNPKANDVAPATP